MGEYFPLSPENKNAEEYNKNLPGLGGVFNSRNLQTYHYAGNNPLKYGDPSGCAITLRHERPDRSIAVTFHDDNSISVEVSFYAGGKMHTISMHPQNWGELWSIIRGSEYSNRLATRQEKRDIERHRIQQLRNANDTWKILLMVLELPTDPKGVATMIAGLYLDEVDSMLNELERMLNEEELDEYLQVLYTQIADLLKTEQELRATMLESANHLDQIIDKLIKDGADPNGEGITELRERAAILRRKAENGRPAE